jgi:hypothetical protein
MFAVLLSWAIALIVFFAFGHSFLRLLKQQEKGAYNFADVFFLGFSLVGTLLTALSLWIPLKGFILLVLFIFSIVYLAIAYRNNQLALLTNTALKIKSLQVSYKIAAALLFLVLLLYCLLPPTNYDTGVYHWQAMMWAETYPVIPGLANFHERFGFNSSTLLLHSVFSLQDIFGFRVTGLNGLSLLVFLTWIIFKIRESKGITQLALVLFTLVLLRFHDTFIASPATDWLPNILIPYLLLRAILDYRSLKTIPLLYWVLPLFCVTMKLAMAPFCLFSLIVLIRLIKNKQYKSLLTSLLIACILLIPWLARNVISTGYLVFPVSSIDLFDVDWKVPVSIIERDQIAIKSWARVTDTDYKKVMALPFSEWGKLWFLHYLGFSRTALLECALAALSPFVVLFTQRKKLIKKPYKTYPWLIAFIGTLFWAVSAPDVRFAFGYITFTAFAPFMLLDSKIEKTFFKKTPLILLFLMLIFFLRMSLVIILNAREDRTYVSFLYKPYTIEYVIKHSSIEFATYKVGDTDVYVPSTPQCLDHELPCTPPDQWCPDCLEMRGKSLKDGFRTKK